jgi:hypothetical protein
LVTAVVNVTAVAWHDGFTDGVIKILAGIGVASVNVAVLEVTTGLPEMQVEFDVISQVIASLFAGDKFNRGLFVPVGSPLRNQL